MRLRSLLSRDSRKSRRRNHGHAVPSSCATPALAERLEQRALLTLAINFDFTVVASDLSPDLRVFGSSDSSDAPFEVIRYGEGAVTSLEGFVGGDILADPGDLTFRAGSMDVNAPVEVLRLDRDSFDDGTSDGIVNQNYLPGDAPTVQFFLAGELFAEGQFSQLNLEVTQNGDTTGVGQIGTLSRPYGTPHVTKHSELRSLMNSSFQENADGDDTRGREFTLTPFQYNGDWAGVGDAEIYTSSGDMTSADDFPDNRRFAPMWDGASPLDGVASRSSDRDVVRVPLDPTQTHVLRVTSTAETHDFSLQPDPVWPFDSEFLSSESTDVNGNATTITFNPKTPNTAVSMIQAIAGWQLEYLSSAPASLNVFFPEEMTVGWTPELDDSNNALPADGYRIELYFPYNAPYHTAEVDAATLEYSLANKLGTRTQYVRIGRIVGDEVVSWSDGVVLAGVSRRVDTLDFDGQTFTWNDIPNVRSYELYFENTEARPIVEGTEYTLPADHPLGYSRMWVRTRAGSGPAAPWSLPRNYVARTPVQQPSVDSSTPERPEISWPALAGAADYDLYIQQAGSGSFTPIEVTGHTGTSWTPDSDLEGGRYRVWVRGSTDTGIKGRWSPPTDFRVSAVPISASGTSDAVTFEWAVPTGSQSVELYILHRGTVTRRSGLQGTTWTENQDFGSGYLSWWVRATDGTGLPGPWSDGSTIRIGNTRITSYPTDPLRDSDTFGLQWDPVLDAASYEVLINSTVEAGVIAQTGLTTTSVDGLSLPGGRYTAWVNTVFGDGSNSYSRPVTFDVMTDGERVIVTAWGTSTNPPTISWVEDERYRATKIFYRRLEDNQNAQVISAYGATSYEFSEALPTGTYRVWAAQLGTGNWSAPIVITIAARDQQSTEEPDILLATLDPLTNRPADETGAEEQAADAPVRKMDVASPAAAAQVSTSANAEQRQPGTAEFAAASPAADPLTAVFADLSDPGSSVDSFEASPLSI